MGRPFVTRSSQKAAQAHFSAPILLFVQSPVDRPLRRYKAANGLESNTCIEPRFEPLKKCFIFDYNAP